MSQFFIQQMCPEPKRGNRSVNRSPQAKAEQSSLQWGNLWFPKPPCFDSTFRRFCPRMSVPAQDSPLLACPGTGGIQPG